LREREGPLPGLGRNDFTGDAHRELGRHAVAGATHEHEQAAAHVVDMHRVTSTFTPREVLHVEPRGQHAVVDHRRALEAVTADCVLHVAVGKPCLQAFER
jgi:hypothetical protein